MNGANILAALNHETPEWVPSYLTDAIRAASTSRSRGPVGGGHDGFGVNWIDTGAAAGSTASDPSIIVLPDVTAWRDVIQHWPEPEKVRLEGMKAASLPGDNPENQIIDYWQFYGPFQRLAALMGFDKALEALLLEPEAVDEFFSAHADYRIKVLEFVKKHMNPDLYTLCDDVAHRQGMFMSPDLYRRLIKPHHARVLSAARDLGMMSAASTAAGRATSSWRTSSTWAPSPAARSSPATTSRKALREHGDRITVVGGYDFQGPPGLGDVPRSWSAPRCAGRSTPMPRSAATSSWGSMLVSGQNLEQRMAKMMWIIQARPPCTGAASTRTGRPPAPRPSPWQRRSGGHERITVAGPEVVGNRLTAAAYAHGFALALPEKVVLARPEDSDLRTFGSGGHAHPGPATGARASSTEPRSGRPSASGICALSNCSIPRMTTAGLHIKSANLGERHGLPPHCAAMAWA